MYAPKHFQINDNDEIYAFIKAHAFGQLITTTDGRPTASHLPFFLSNDRRTLLGHVARQNPQWQGIDGQTVLVSLQGPHDYVSPSWYSSPNVPTWNYQSVHIYGQCKTFTDPARLRDVVDGLAATYESSFDEPWQPAYPDSMLNAIVGFEVLITDVQCTYKLSQNKPRKDRLEVIRQLEERGSHALARAMSKNEES